MSLQQEFQQDSALDSSSAKNTARACTSGRCRSKPNDMYQNYYAAMALHHAGGPEWKTWNAQMREQLIRAQIKSGPAAGSWSVTDPHGQSAGQIYQTALSVLTLEVYYRYLPLYRIEE